MIINEILIEYKDRAGDSLTGTILVESLDSKKMTFETIEDYLIEGEYLILEQIKEIDSEFTPRSLKIKDNGGTVAEDHPYTKVIEVNPIDKSKYCTEKLKYAQEHGQYLELVELLASLKDEYENDWNIQNSSSLDEDEELLYQNI